MPGTPGTASSATVYCAQTGPALPDSLVHWFAAMMPPRIRAEIAGYKRWQDRQATLFGKLLLLRALRASSGDAAPVKLHSLEKTGNGKPRIPGEPDFNISHSGDLVVLAVAGQGSIGIDVEKIRPVDLKDFSRHLPEVTTLQKDYDDDTANTLFFDCWTRKEAVLKACGKGLSAPLDQVSLQADSASLYGRTWFLRNVPLQNGYRCHIATENHLEQVAVEYVDLISRPENTTPLQGR